MNIEELEVALDEASAAFETLRTEQKRLGRAITEAVALNDTKALAALTKRQAELPDALFNAEVTMIQAEVALLEAESQLDASAQAELKPKVLLQEQEVKAAQKTLTDLQRQAGRIDERQQGRRSKKNARKRRLEAIMSEQAGTALHHLLPVVRTWQNWPPKNR